MPEHLDWHSSLEDYIEAKANIFRHQTTDDIAIYFANNRYSQQIAGFSSGQKILYFAPPGAVKEFNSILVGSPEVEITKAGEIKLLGEHNLEHVCAVLIAVWHVTHNSEAAQKVLHIFAVVTHVIQLW